ncbi:MAG: magnesium chelatase [Parcubacteria group bacterium CG1_02_40_82]|uniref:Magnesium chelatase n=4 Tax=Candidatus Portnoyibacteriota TaxID=1817913 RepID=A0A2M7IH39_9BACT|nr:MAG: magnesium chelatase [Parcubacteria group bacterium CG1_02_40_82]PIQ75496.1 MAG: magnesium chelatase [Candidatus Portnoybacteria bacterium CG11_big_fil_rev_8_21_14_0_20_40_15]PIS30681.1 MAG: magnesium chelatase [Candidatus Portnoybacteria bacterium CG08_land_8_20_14_0_20_40_83]PIW75815.1 MAG: magnesium chelatase [Candidatus Portnoybacteria bacterium CG_4_8_14_3_um_filter_40_10]PIY75208.1 MAG: magnesium chelatase [Candidatus Portnoybacteria bacterium CG_4_10_14_0_8_um_filter_40_50]PJA644
MPSKIFSAALVGLDCLPIEVEVDMSPGLHNYSIVGLPDAAVKESKERVSSAIKNSGASPPHHSNRRVTVNLAPADLKKEGPSYDLPIAVAYLIASEQVAPKNIDLEKSLFLAELSLDGKLRHVNGVLAAALMAKEKGFENLFVPKADAAEAALVEGLKIFGAETLEDLFLHLEGKQIMEQNPLTDVAQYYIESDSPYDMAYIRGQEHAKRALEIAAAGAHNLIMSGPPGAGKTLLARTMPTILPPLNLQESLQVTKIFSVAGRLREGRPLITERPFRSPHHTASAPALVGGGNHPKPGEITLAHRGVLFMDEFPEFHRDVLEALRQPLEDGVVTVSRAQGTLNFPARFILIAAMNPCPCGNATNPLKTCICSQGQISRYRRRISGPLMDRIDLHIEVPALKYEKLASEKVSEESSAVRKRVQSAREVQRQRFGNQNSSVNSEMSIQQIKEHCQIDSASQQILKNAVNTLHLSARGYHRVLKLARTIADLAAEPRILASHLAEALQYRAKEEI